MLWQRFLTAIIGIPLTLVVIYLGGWWLAAFVGIIALIALREFYQLLAARERFVYPQLGYPLAIATILANTAINYYYPIWDFFSARLEAFLLLFGFALSVILISSSPKSSKVDKYLLTLVAHLCTVQLLSYLLRLRQLGDYPIPVFNQVIPSGACWLFLIFAACWALDTGAYAVGKKWGKRRLFPTISPSKTLEGAIGGLGISILVVTGLGSWFGLHIWQGLLLGLMLGVMGQIGDLAESKLKRWAGVKDSGAILPGHGGILDRFDSLLVNAPLAYYFLRSVLGS